VDRIALVAVLVTVTAAFGINAPLGSLTSPVICPAVWANAMTDAKPNKPIKTSSLRMQLLPPSKSVIDATLSQIGFQRKGDFSPIINNFKTLR
jgi:hypothetical protein